MNYRNIAIAASALGLALTLTACGGNSNNQNSGNGGTAGQVHQLNPLHVAHNKMTHHTLNINMGQMQKSGQAGSASVADAKGGVDVTVLIKGEPKGASEPSHIHQGTCAKLNPAPWKPLTPVVNGKSFTHLAGVTVAEIKKGKYAINVHKSATDLKTYVACGDLHL